MPQDNQNNDEFFSSEAGPQAPPYGGLARTLAEGMDYDFAQAIADLIDNSIAEDAQNVWVHVKPKTDTQRAYVAVVDDGNGMSKEKLFEALTYGRKSDDEKKNLGRFGLGLKTASTSQSWVVMVATRKEPESDFNLGAWDIPWLETPEGQKDGGWGTRIPLIEKFPEETLDSIKHSSGTVVLLPDLTRMRGFSNEWSSTVQSEFLSTKLEECENHMSVVFHRFLSGETLSEEYRGTQINMFVNGRPVPPCDPFMTSHTSHEYFSLPNDKKDSLTLLATDSMDGGPSGPLTLNYKGRHVTFQFHLLPSRRHLTADEHKRGAVGIGWLNAQGVYIYRLDRLIEFGGWCRLSKRDEHTKLGRLSIDLGREWDELIELTATKNEVVIPQGTLRDEFKTMTMALRTKAKETEVSRREPRPTSPGQTPTAPSTEGGTTESPSPGGTTESPSPGGTTESPSPGGTTESPSPGGATESPSPGGTTESPSPGGTTESPSPGGTSPPDLDPTTFHAMIAGCVNDDEVNTVSTVWERITRAIS